MSIAIRIAQALKIASGVFQVGFAVWLLIRGPRSIANVAFAIFFAANGIAYTLFNLSVPGQRGLGSLPLLGWGFFNWIAILAVVAFVVAILHAVERWKAALVAGITVAAVVLVALILIGRAYHLTVLEFGGVAVYAGTALALGVLPVVFHLNPSKIRPLCAFLAAALAINSVDHLGAELVQPGPNSQGTVLIQIAAMSVVLALWLWNAWDSSSTDSRSSLLVACCMIGPFLAGVLVRVWVGSYRGVQESGLIGVGRLAATGLLIYAMLGRGIFSSTRELDERGV